MKMNLDQALSAVFEDLMSMETSDFLTELEEFKGGEISQLLLHMSSVKEFEVFALFFDRVIDLEQIDLVKRFEVSMGRGALYSLTEAANDEDYSAYFLAA